MNEHDAEVNGDTALDGTPQTASALPPPAATDGTSIDSSPAKRKRGKGKPFLPGADPRRNLAGRPPAGETFAEKYIAATQAHADEMIAAHVRRSKTNTAVGARDFELAAAYHMGRPLQKFAGVVVETPLAGLLQDLAALRQPQTDDDIT